MKQNNPFGANGRSGSQPRPAKWLENNGQLPAIAFVCPVAEDDLHIIEQATSGAAGEQWVTDWAEAEFKSRCAGALPGFEDKSKVAAGQVEFFDAELGRCRDNLEKTPERLTATKTAIAFPAGFLKRWVVVVFLILCSQILLEWWNGASFARFELDDMKAALAFTYSLALAPIALKLFASEPAPWKRFLYLLLCCSALFGFVHVFTESYITSNSNQSADQILDQIGQPLTPPAPFWQEPLNPRWRFMWQTILFTLIGFAFSNHLARQITVVSTTEDLENPAYGLLQVRLTKLTKDRQNWGQSHSEAEGNRREWESSLQRHILRCLAIFHDVEQRRHDMEALENFLKQKVARQPNRNFNHNPNQRN